MIRIFRPDCPNPVALRTNYKVAENKEAIKAACHDKCMYCESKISHVYHGDVEHIRPKSVFPESEFEWSNLGYVCAKCNGAKGAKYNEACPYVNPFEENPEDFFITRDCMLDARRGNERASLTISDIELNRPALFERRKEKLDNIQRFISLAFSRDVESLKDAAIREVASEAAVNKEYSLFVKNLIRLNEL